jgi:hypothetical protein
MRNELSGTETTLFNGKMKVVKAPSNEASYVNHFVYYVDHDWNLPIGYIFYERMHRAAGTLRGSGRVLGAREGGILRSFVLPG